MIGATGCSAGCEHAGWRTYHSYGRLRRCHRIFLQTGFGLSGCGLLYALPNNPTGTERAVLKRLQATVREPGTGMVSVYPAIAIELRRATNSALATLYRCRTKTTGKKRRNIR
jgi:hypothetical protein